MVINFDILKVIRESIDWLLELPDKIVLAIYRPSVSMRTARQRIALLRELAELDEVSKAIGNLYFSKGSIIAWIEDAQKQRSKDDVEYIRYLFRDAASGIRGIKETLGATVVGSTLLTTEAALLLTRAELAYEKLAKEDDDTLLTDTAIVEIAKKMEYLTSRGRELMEALDNRRRILRGHHGGFYEEPEQISSSQASGG